MTKSMLHPGARWLFRVRAYVILIFIGIFVSAFVGNIIGAILLLAFGISKSSIIAFILSWLLFYILFVVIIAEIYARMAYKRWFYEFTDTNLKLERGIIWKRYSNVPYERVQNVDIHRGILARWLGFSSVMIQTAGYSAGGRGGMAIEGSIPAVDVETAEKIRDFLMNKISKHSRSGV